MTRHAIEGQLLWHPIIPVVEIDDAQHAPALAEALLEGGISVIDFTESANPVEIGYFDRGPLSDEDLMLGGFWSAYWYGDKIYGTEIIRGLDVLELLPSAHLSAAEIAAAGLADQGRAFNPQQQYPVSWPDHPVVAQAYIDQLQRSGVLEAQAASQMVSFVDAAANGEPEASEQAIMMLRQVSATGRDGQRLERLRALLQGM